jgi:hypothetical protein
MDTPGNCSAQWTQTNASGRSDLNNGLITFVVRTLYNKPTRHQTGAVECLLHGVDSPPIKAPRIPQTASKVSQSQYCRPNDTKACVFNQPAVIRIVRNILGDVSNAFVVI